MPRPAFAAFLVGSLALSSAVTLADDHDVDVAAQPPAEGPATRPDAGAYLAGRLAQGETDYSAAARYLGRARASDPDDLSIALSLIESRLGLGYVEDAGRVARALGEDGRRNQVSALAIVATEAREGDWQDILEGLDDDLSVSSLFDDLARGWALIGTGAADRAFKTFDGIEGESTLRAFAIYHKALAQAALGRFEDALATLENGGDRLTLPRRGTIAHAQILSQLGRNDDAFAILDAEFGADTDPAILDLRDRLDAGETLDFTIAPDAVAGLGEAAFDIATLLATDASPTFALTYVRIAQFLRPGSIEAVLLTAMILETLEQFDLASETYALVPQDHPSFPNAALGRAEVLRQSGEEEKAIAALRALASEAPDLAIVPITLGDTLREMERYEEARQAYDEAVSLFTSEDEVQWIVYFARGITAERVGDWEAAKADFRRALELNPDQPNVLNYLGYSMVEERENLEEALDLIERAVAAAPDAGFIIDSLGWALFRLGRYQEAVAPMERAVELMPVDPVVNDHLGDVLWAVGRRLEARFQWQRALSFIDGADAQDIDPERIRRKLEVGLDTVLEEEGAAPLEVANDG